MAFSPTFANERAPGAGVTAVLGPTNTGKTHLAIERMIAHSSGIIGLPLRLLAREVYNKIVARVGAEAVALITGEEKIKPKNPRFWVSTVEAMPRDLDVSFLAVDEIQIAADLERGHVFTDRILNRRGRDETLLLGAATMRPIIERLLPGASIVTRPRLSQLEFAGDRKITRQPRRTAIVAFSADEVYAIAELIRRQHGGAAVVLGSLSPRTRNAQVEMFQNGDVDYLVATDAVGMGLNLDVDHVAFASDRKYDGYQFRRLNPAEFAQIAGRAGRATRDGTFGTTGRCAPFEPELVNALQNHTFDSVKVLQWRNAKLDFASLGALQVSLALTPGHDALTRAPIAEDMRVLDHAARDADVRDMAHGAAAVERLWDACQIPDYRKIAPAAHAELVTTLFEFLMKRGRIPDAWFAAQVELADRTDGDIDTLSGRIAQIRTWTFVANRPDWLADPEHWQGMTREIENKLSDALHERLTERFVDRRTSVLMRRLRENSVLNTEIGKTGEVIVEGHVIGRLDGFTFAPEAAEAGSDAKALQAAALKALAGEIDARAEKLAAAPDDQFVLTSDGTIRWTGDAVAKLMSADDALHPRIRIVSDERLAGAPREAVQARLDLWLKTHIEKLLGPLFDLNKAEDVTGIARGIAFQLIESLGVLGAHEDLGRDEGSRPAVARLLAQIRRALRRLSHLSAGAPEAGGAVAGLAAVGAEGRQCRPVGAVGRAASGGFGTHLVPGRQGPASRRLSRAGLSAMRRARGAGRYPGAARGFDPARSGLARNLARRKARRRVRRPRFCRHASDDVADRIGRRGFRLDPARARLSHGAPRAAAAEAGGGQAPAAEAPAEAATEAAAAGEASSSATLLPDIAFGAEPAESEPAESEPAAAEAVPEPEISAELVEAAPAAETPVEAVEAALAEALAEPETPVEPVETAAAEAPAEPAAVATAAAEATPDTTPDTTSETAATGDAAPAEAAASDAAPVEAGAAEVAEAPRRKPPRRPNWSKSGGPAAAPKSAGRAMTATVLAITTVPRKARLAPPPSRARPATPPRANATAADGATVTTSSANCGPMRRRQMQRPRRAQCLRRPAAPEPREDRAQQPRERFQGKGREGDKGRDRNKDRDKDRGKFGGGRDKSGRDRDKGGPSHRQYATSAAPRERDRPVDPNSPFAKLAALKEQLAANRKD